MKEISLSLVGVVEVGAISASKWFGSGTACKIKADKASTDSMRERLNKINFCGMIVIGEGKKDKSFGLYEGELVGVAKNGLPNSKLEVDYDYDIAIDPIDGTTPTVKGGPEAISTLAIANKDCMYRTDEHYMLKAAVGRKAAVHLENMSINTLLGLDLKRIVIELSGALNKEINELTVCILDRNRHSLYIKTLRKLGCRVKLIQDCDVGGAIATCLPDSGVDLYYGIGGAPEAVLAAAAMKCLKGRFEVQHVDENLSPIGDIIDKDDLVKGECSFVATGITDGSILKGVRYKDGPITHSVFMRSKSGTVRWIEAYHGN